MINLTFTLSLNKEYREALKERKQLLCDAVIDLPLYVRIYFI